MSNDKIQMTNEIQNPNSKYNLAERTACFGEDVIDFSKTLERNEINRSLVSQLVRSATSIGANYMEADGADSKRDFCYKIGVCKREAKETRHWLRMAMKANPRQGTEIEILDQEAKELSLIFVAIVRSSKMQSH